MLAIDLFLAIAKRLAVTATMSNRLEFALRKAGTSTLTAVEAGMDTPERPDTFPVPHL